MAVVCRRLRGLCEEGPDTYRIRAKPLNAARDNALQKFLYAQRMDIQQRYEDIFNEETHQRLQQRERIKMSNTRTAQKVIVI
uniref:Transposase n=1 Tax=Heterorhabditis bacteriophora TaxID=37862 RepID=A0A1I7X374_HETBA